MTTENPHNQEGDYENIDHEKVKRLANEIASLPDEAYRAVTLKAFYIFNRKLHEEKIRRAEVIVERDKLQQKVNTDDNSETSSWKYLTERIYELLVSKKPFAFIFTDLDEFGQVNKVMEHWIGDYIIWLAAQGIKSSFRTTDIGKRKADLVGRYAGDEFVILQVLDRKALNDLKREGQLEKYCQKVEQNMKKNINIRLAGFKERINEPDFMELIEGKTEDALEVINNIGISAGIALPQPGDTVLSLQSRAEKMMKMSKLAKKKSK